MKEKSKRLFGEMLVWDEVITSGQLEEALKIQQEQAKIPGKEVDRVGVILQRLGYLDKVTLEEYINKVIVSNFF